MLTVYDIILLYLYPGLLRGLEASRVNFYQTTIAVLAERTVAHFFYLLFVSYIYFYPIKIKNIRQKLNIYLHLNP